MPYIWQDLLKKWLKYLINIVMNMTYQQKSYLDLLKKVFFQKNMKTEKIKDKYLFFWQVLFNSK